MRTVVVKGGAPEKHLGDLAACKAPPAEKRADHLVQSPVDPQPPAENRAEHCAQSAYGSSGLHINRPKDQKINKI